MKEERPGSHHIMIMMHMGEKLNRLCLETRTYEAVLPLTAQEVRTINDSNIM